MESDQKASSQSSINVSTDEGESLAVEDFSKFGKIIHVRCYDDRFNEQPPDDVHTDDNAGYKDNDMLPRHYDSLCSGDMGESSHVIDNVPNYHHQDLLSSQSIVDSENICDKITGEAKNVSNGTCISGNGEDDICEIDCENVTSVERENEDVLTDREKCGLDDTNDFPTEVRYSCQNVEVDRKKDRVISVESDDNGSNEHSLFGRNGDVGDVGEIGVATHGGGVTGSDGSYCFPAFEVAGNSRDGSCHERPVSAASRCDNVTNGGGDSASRSEGKTNDGDCDAAHGGGAQCYSETSTGRPERGSVTLIADPSQMNEGGI